MKNSRIHLVFDCLTQHQPRSQGLSSYRSGGGKMRGPGNKVDPALHEEVCSQDRNISVGEAEERRTGSGSRVEDITPPPPSLLPLSPPSFHPHRLLLAFHPGHVLCRMYYHLERKYSIRRVF